MLGAAVTSKRGRLSLLGEIALKDLRDEARLERALARFSADDDTTHPPDGDPLASAQSRRLPVEVHQ
jgi:hypothetical protein